MSSLTIASDALEDFCYWVLEREDIRIRKECGMPRPWTDDPILQNFHFCNIRREDDRGTVEIRKEVVNKAPLVETLPAVYTAARLLNKADSLAVLLDNKGYSTLKEIRNRGGVVFHTAYVVSTCGQRMDKLDYCQTLVDEVRMLQVPRTSCREAYQELLKVDGLGSFLAGQIVADLKNDRYLVDAPDWHTFSVMGPGSKKGLDFLFAQEHGGTTHRNYEERMTALEEALPEDIRRLNLHRQDLQNCLCEFSKYIRYKRNLNGRRRPYK